MAMGLQTFDNLHLSTLWEWTPAEVQFFQDYRDIPFGYHPIVIADFPESSGYRGWHMDGLDGTAFGKVFAAPTLNRGGSVLLAREGTESVSASAGHELAEIRGNKNLNLWVDGPAGFCYFRELCDAVQRFGYQVKLPSGQEVTVPNFLLPAWFDQTFLPESRFDYMGICKKPFEIAPGGYSIVRTRPGDETRITSSEPPPEWILYKTVSRFSTMIERGKVMSDGT